VVGVLGLLSLFFVTMPLTRRRHAALARKRRAIGEGEFVTMMAFAGVSGTTARFLWKELGLFYHAPVGKRDRGRPARTGRHRHALLGIDARPGCAPGDQSAGARPDRRRAWPPL